MPIARFVGHKVGTLAADTYSAGGSEKLALEVAAKVRHGKKVEAAAPALVRMEGGRPPPRTFTWLTRRRTSRGPTLQVVNSESRRTTIERACR